MNNDSHHIKFINKCRSVKIIVGDITKLQVDAIVNAANIILLIFSTMCICNLNSAFSGDSTHAIRKIHRNALDHFTLICRQLHEHSQHISRIRSLDDCDDCSFAAMSILIVNNGVQLTLEGSFVCACPRQLMLSLRMKR